DDEQEQEGGPAHGAQPGPHGAACSPTTTVRASSIDTSSDATMRGTAQKRSSKRCFRSSRTSPTWSSIWLAASSRESSSFATTPNGGSPDGAYRFPTK